MRKSITFRLREGLDRDLILAIESLDKNELSDKARNGLRLMLGINTAPSTQVVEQSIMIPQQKPQERQGILTLKAKPTPYKPKS